MNVDATETEAAPWTPLPNRFGPRRRWWFLALWIGCILAIVATQKLSAHSFEHGYWTGGGLTEPTSIELLWYWLPLFLIVLVAIVFLVGLQWWVPEKGTRGMIRVWGLVPTFVGLLGSLGISTYFYLVFYMD